MEGTYISWNLVNWITVVLMVSIGLVLVAGASSVVRQNLPSD
jgi:uncharacterized membrane protein YkvI